MATRNIYWLISFLISGLLSLALAWHFIKVNAAYQPDSSQIYDQASLQAYLNHHWQMTNSENIPAYIPTGVYINSIQWIDSYTFFVAGYVWQKYAHRYKGKINQGFVLPEAADLKTKVAYRFDRDNEEVIGWYFEGKIHQRFDYSRFPFDHKTVRIRLWHKDFDQRALITPDFAGYDDTRPIDTFGIDPQIVLAGYDIKESFFRYQTSHYDANFGYGTTSVQKHFPELYFNIVLKRHAIDAMIIYVLPLTLVFILCFCSLLSSTFDEQRRNIFNFRYLGILTECASLFFVVLLAHIHLREVFTGVGIIYLEYIYVLTYLSIIYVTLNSFLVVHAEFSDYSIYRIVRYEDNIIPKILFLPLFSAATLFISLVFF